MCCPFLFLRSWGGMTGPLILPDS
ncbi:MAG: hypothetical protein RIS38_1218, partial [Verrucomicrobiota bacterium]